MERLDVALVAVPLLVLTAVATFLAVRRGLRVQPASGGPAGAVLLRWPERTGPAVAARPRVAAPRPGAEPVRRRR